MVLVARDGGNPLARRDRGQMTFEQAAGKVYELSLPTWKSERHGRLWLRSLELHAFPHFGDRPISKLGSQDVLGALSPIWSTKPSTAKRIRQRIQSVFDWAKGAGYFEGENPVFALRMALPKSEYRVRHHPAMDWREVPELMAQLAMREGTSALCLRFIILTALRSSEARGIRWCEIDGDVLTVPADRMKSKRPHRVPLAGPTIEILRESSGLHDELVFPNQSGRPLSVMAFKSLFQRMGLNHVTTHGFRSTFRDWCSESACAPRELAEAALSHQFGTAIERAYARSDLFQRRSDLMSKWSEYATSVGNA